MSWCSRRPVRPSSPPPTSATCSRSSATSTTCRAAPVDFDALWDYSQPGETEARFRALLPQAEASGDVSYLAQLLTQIGRAQGLQGNFEGASHTLDRVDGLGVHDIPVAR